MKSPIRRLISGKKTSIGLIGLGYISNIHIEAYTGRRDVWIKAISDSNQSLLLQRGKALGLTEVYPDYHFMLADSTINVVDIMTPHYLHKQCVCDALSAGKTVICEKPLATTVKDVDAMIKAAQTVKRRIYVKQYLRFSTAYKKAKELIQKNIIGTPYYVQCMFTGNSVKDYQNPLTWRASVKESGGGVFMDIGVHMLDLLFSIFGKPISVYAECKKVLSKMTQKGEDLTAVMLDFPNNILVNLACTHVDVGYRFRWEVRIYGTNGVMTIIDQGKQAKELNVIRENQVVYQFVEIDWWRQANLGALNDIMEKIKSGQEPAVPLSEVRDIINIIEQSYRSSRLGKKIFL